MKKMTLLLVAVALIGTACSSGVAISKFSGIEPGMTCENLDNYLKTNKIPFKKDGTLYQFTIKESAWKDATVLCNEVVTEIAFDSKEAQSAKAAQAYIDAQQSLLKAFKGNVISYEEGSRVIDLNNGVKLHQYPDSKSGVITHFKVSIDGTGNDVKEAWQRAAVLLPEVGVSK